MMVVVVGSEAATGVEVVVREMHGGEEGVLYRRGPV